MSSLSRSDRRADAARLERDLLARLGLKSGVDGQEIESAHDALVGFLDGAPPELRDWARRQIAAVDEAYALLSNPATDLAALAAADAAVELVASDVTRTASAPLPAAVPATSDLEEFEDAPPPKRQARRGTPRRPVASPQPAGGRIQAAWSSRVLRRLAAGVALAAAAVVIAFVGYNIGAPSVPGVSGTPAPSASAAATLDPAQVADLMKKIAANPKDIASLQALSDLYFQTGDYANAVLWMEKILAIDPKNLTALVALGAADFNQGKASEAEQLWRQALAIDPQNVEVHYDLGFMYLSQSPPDMANVKAEWQKVIDLAPDSDIAKNVATHLASLDGSPAPSGSPAASASPGSPAPASPTPVPTAGGS